MDSLEDRIKYHARSLGFELVGIAAAGPADTFATFQQWLDDGHAGEMDYMHRHGPARQDPSSILAEVRSVIMAGMNYKQSVPTVAPNQGRIAQYALGHDYHEVLRSKLKQLLKRIQDEEPRCHGRAVVDTAPLLERDFARRAGLGWFGKNTMLIHKKLGSFFFIGALLLDLELQTDASHESSHWGTCTACLDACPTDAFVSPGQLDSRRCISYLTIELRSAIPEGLRSGVGDWLFGCDVCQDVCPWNRKAPHGSEPLLQPRSDLDNLDLLDLFKLSETEFSRMFQGSAILRSRRSGILRNAAIVLGNGGDADAIPVLQEALSDDDPLVREAAHWAIAQIRSRIGDVFSKATKE